jgi:hypothetical protein
MLLSSSYKTPNSVARCMYNTRETLPTHTKTLVVNNSFVASAKHALLLAVFLLVGFAQQVLGQNINMPSGTNSIWVTGGNFFDNGGSGSNYSSSFNGTLTIYPAITGMKVRIVFSSFATENSSCTQNYDWLRIFNGNSTSATALHPTGCTVPGFRNSGAPMTVPATFTSTAADGSLTVNFKSDGTTTAAGWAAVISLTGDPCGGTFYDVGGPSGNYWNNVNQTYTFFPTNQTTQKVRLNFTQFVTEASSCTQDYDWMRIYNGANTSAPALHPTGCSVVGFRNTGAPMTVPASFTSTASNGSLTVNFKSDAGTAAAGWTATVECFVPCTVPTTYTVSGGGRPCPSETRSVVLSGSQTGVSYMLKRDGSNVSSLSGTGNALTWSGLSTSGTYTVEASGSGYCTTTMSGNAVITSTSTSGNPATFGSNTWNVYGYNGSNRDDLSGLTYRGFYSQNLGAQLGFNTQSAWSSSLSPSYATGYAGCDIEIDNHTVVHKRQGFTAGNYQISIDNWDDGAILYVDGVERWRADVWSGNSAHGFTVPHYITDCITLGASSTVEFRTAEGTGGSNAQISFSSCGCPNGDNLSEGTVSLGTCGNFSTTTIAANTYRTVNVVQGVSYSFSTCNAASPASTKLTIKENNNSDVRLAYSAGYGPDCPTDTRGSLDWTGTYTGTVRAYVNRNSCEGSWNGTSAVLKVRQNTTLTNTTSNAVLCLDQTRNLTYTLGGAHNNPAVQWTIISGGGSITNGVYTPGSPGTGKTIRATLGVCSQDVTFDVITCGPPTITSFTPTSSCAGVVQNVEIVGTNFFGVTDVKLGTQSIPFYYVNNNDIYVEVPANASSGAFTVTTPNGQVTSSSTYTVNTAPSITTQPANLTLCEGSGGNFTVATSASSPTYLWQYYDGAAWQTVNIPPYTSGHTTATLAIATVPASFNGAQIRCIVTSNGCSTTSGTATLTVNGLPAIINNPVDVTMCTGLGTQTLSVNATGAGLTYQWKKNGTNLSNDATYSGVTTATLTITAPAGSEDGALFSVEVSGTCSPSVLSSEALLTLSGSTAAYPTNVYATNYIICEGQSINLNATAQGFTMNWFTQSSGGTAFTTSASGVNTSAIFPTANTTYYVEAQLGSCVSPRIEVGTVYIIANNPPLIGYVAPQRRCDAGQVTLTSVTCSPGVINWYDSPQACVPIFTGNPYQPTVSSTTNFYTNVTDATARYAADIEPSLSANTFNGLSGQMFDVQAAPGKTIEIKAIKVRSYYSSSQVLKVYYKTEALTQPGSFPVGQMSSSGWIQVHNGTYTGAGSESTLSGWITLQNKIVVPAGCRFAIYIEHPVYYRGNSSSADDRNNNDITVYGSGFGGASCTGSFNMCAASNRAFRGALQYDVKFVSPIVTASVVIDNSVSVPSIVGDDIVCKGQTIDLDTDNLPTGGTITSVGGYRIHTFTSGGNFVVPAHMSPLKVEVLVVAGGGGGGNGRGGGGGAGGLIYNPSFSVSGSNSVSVGNGGAANTNGQNSSFATLTAIGGGRGGSHLSVDAGGSGGSGGGAAMNYGSNIWAGGAATSGQGYSGGTSGSQGTDNPRNTGGGGGAGGPGVSGSGTNVRPTGGNGLAYDISGSIKYYAAGGGGSRGGTDMSSAGAGYGGTGGGGTGGGDLTQTAGQANTGSGGGGSEGTGSAGGSGIVIVRYPDPTLGVWSSTNTASATINSTSGIVSGVAAGSSNIKYTLTTPVGCVGEKTKNIAVREIPAIPVVSDDSPVCEGVPLNISSKGLAPGGEVATLDNSTNQISGNAFTGTTNNHTIEFWVNPTKAVVLHSEINSGVSGNLGAPTTEYSFAIGPNLFGGSGCTPATVGIGVSVGTNGVEVVQHGPCHFPVTLSYAATLSGWTHIAVVHNNNTPTLYVNGVFAKTGLASLYPTFPNSSVSYGYGYFGGSIDNIRVWNVAKTQSEIVQQMNLETPSVSTGLIAHYPLNGNANALVGTNNTNSGATFSTPSYYTYTWSGTNAPSPVSSTLENRVVFNAAVGNSNLTVTASVGGCASGNASTDVEIKSNNQTSSSWNGTSTDDATDWFDPKNWSNCTPGDQTVVTISRAKPSYPVITNTSAFDTANPKGKAKAKKVTLDTTGIGTDPTLNINTSTELRVNE